MKKVNPTNAEGIIRISPTQYINVLDNITNTKWAIEGLLLYSKMDQETIITPPTEKIKLPSNSYCNIANPV